MLTGFEIPLEKLQNEKTIVLCLAKKKHKDINIKPCTILKY